MPRTPPSESASDGGVPLTPGSVLGSGSAAVAAAGDAQERLGPGLGARGDAMLLGALVGRRQLLLGALEFLLLLGGVDLAPPARPPRRGSARRRR